MSISAVPDETTPRAPTALDAAQTASEASPNPVERLRDGARNLTALFIAQGLLGAQLMIHIALGPLVGASLGPSPIWATAPITAMVLASMAAAGPASLLMGKIGRRAGFLMGCFCGMAAGALAAAAIAIASFPLFLIASALFGVYQAHQNLYRFAAAESVAERFRPTAMGLVLAGGLVSAFVGPAVAAGFKDALAPLPLAGAYAAIVGLNLIGLLPLAALRAPRPTAAETAATATPAPRRTLKEILRVPEIRVAILCGMVTYALMSLVMTTTSSAMVIGCGFGVDEAGAVIGAHVFAMFAPSFFTGAVISRIGARAVIAIGLALLAAAGAVALAGVAFENFLGALILLGVGWNFGFIGASSMLMAHHRPEERPMVQGFNDFCVFGLVAFASLTSGGMFHAFGWEAVNLAMLPFLTLAAVALIWTALARPPAAADGTAAL